MYITFNKNIDNNFPTEKITEGKTEIIVPKLEAFKSKASDYAPSKAPVFYNPIMELNRDFAILAVKSYQKMLKREISFCEPLTSSGIRGVRMGIEIPEIEKIIIGDISFRAIKLATQNVKLNDLEKLISIENEDANFLLSKYGAPKRRFDVIDVDPFGSPVPYLDTALRALRNNGMIALTATDLAPLCGVHPKACRRKYGGKPLRTEYCHENAVRILSGCVAATAAKYDIGSNLLFSHSNDHYLRVYVQIKYGAKKADISVNNLGYILHCFECFHRETIKHPFSKLIKKCPKCNSNISWMGPLWLGEIFNKKFCDLMLEENKHVAFKNNRKIRKIILLGKEEVNGPTTYFVIDKICDKLSLPVPSINSMIKKLRDIGFSAVPTQFNTRGIRTNAPAIQVQKLIKDFTKK